MAITANTYVQDTMKIGCQTSFNRDALHMLLAGDQVYSTEVRRWCPDRQCFAASQDQLPTGQADVFEVHAPRFSSHLQLSSAPVGISIDLTRRLVFRINAQSILWVFLSVYQSNTPLVIWSGITPFFMSHCCLALVFTIFPLHKCKRAIWALPILEATP